MFSHEMNDYVTQYGRNTTLYGWKHDDVYPVWQECYSVWLEHYVSEVCVRDVCRSYVPKLCSLLKLPSSSHTERAAGTRPCRQQLLNTVYIPKLY